LEVWGKEPDRREVSYGEKRKKIRNDGVVVRLDTALQTDTTGGQSIRHL
jgi:hypothetical protein